jgi:zinc protease
MTIRNHKALYISLLFITFFIATGQIVGAQSGRQRPRQEPEQKKPADSKKSDPADKRSSTPSASQANRPPGRVLVPGGAAIVNEEHSGVTSRYVFKNGITLVVREDHALPIASSVVYVKAGVGSEPENQAGAARVVARLLAESYAGRAGENLLRELRRQGGILKSKTDFDSTTYTLLGPAGSFAKLLEFHVKSLTKRNFTTEEVTSAANLVAQANKLKLDDSLKYSEQRVIQASFTPLNEISIAAVETGLIAKEQAQAFYDQNYISGNIIIAVAGDVNVDAVRLVVQQYLGDLRSGNAHSKATAAAAPTQTEARYFEERADISQTVVSVAYPVPGLKDKDSATFEVLSAMLTFGRGAVLPQVLESAFTSKVSARYTASNKGGLFIFQVQASPDKLAKAEEILFETIENLRRVIFSPGELQRAKSLLEKQYYDRTLSSTELVGQLAFWEARGGYKNFDNYMQRINGVTAEQIQQLAAQHFSFKTSVVHEYQPRGASSRIPNTDPVYTPERFRAFVNVLVPRTHKDLVEKDEITYAPETPVAKQGKEKREEVMEAGFIIGLVPQPIKDFSTLHGPRAFVREDQSRPLLSMGVYFQGGRLLETEGNNGITELMLRAMLDGTQRLSGSALALKLEQLGAEIKVVNNPDFFGFTLEVLSRNSEEAIKTVIDILESPTFDKDAFIREKASLLNAARAMRDDSQQRPIELFHTALYGSHPYGLPRLGREGSIQSLTETDVANWYQRFVRRQLPLVVFVGDTEGSALVGRFVASGFARRAEVDSSLSVPVVPASNSAPDRIEQRDRRQTAQVLGFSGPDGKSTDNYVVEVIRQIVDGPGGRFLTNLQQQGLSFDLNAEIENRQQRSSFLVYVNSAPEQEKRARSLIEEEFKRLVSSPPSEEEIEAGRNCAIAATIEDLHDHGRRAVAYARNVFFGLPAADIDNLPDKFGAINKEAVRKVLQTYFLPDRLAAGVLRANSSSTAPATNQSNVPSGNR